MGSNGHNARMVYESRRAGRVLHNEQRVRAAEDATPMQDELILRLLCECGDVDCEATVRLPAADYFELRAEHMFAIADDCRSRELVDSPTMGEFR